MLRELNRLKWVCPTPVDLEHMDDESLKRLRDIYERLGSQARSDKKEKNWSG